MNNPTPYRGAFLSFGESDLATVTPWLERQTLEYDTFQVSQIRELIEQIKAGALSWVVISTAGHFLRLRERTQLFELLLTTDTQLWAVAENLCLAEDLIIWIEELWDFAKPYCTGVSKETSLPVIHRMLEGIERTIDRRFESVVSVSIPKNNELGTQNDSIIRVPNPRWDKANGTLFIGNTVIKRLSERATNQILILDAFEEEGWLPRIDDPIPPRDGLVPQIRLHRTIEDLNDKHIARGLLRFHVMGNGQQVCWQIFPQPPKTESSPDRDRKVAE